MGVYLGLGYRARMIYVPAATRVAVCWWGTTMDMETEFYGRRIAEERAAATNAENPSVRERHTQLASLYAEKLRKIMQMRGPSSKPVLRMVLQSVDH